MVLFCIPCLTLLLYFAIASIFVPRYRIYIKEGWRCFIDKLRGKKCSVSFDNRMRLKISAWFSKKGMPRIGKFLYNERNFNWTLIIIGVGTTVLSIYLMVVFINFIINPPCTVDTCSA